MARKAITGAVFTMMHHWREIGRIRVWYHNELSADELQGVDQCSEKVQTSIQWQGFKCAPIVSCADFPVQERIEGERSE
jgi:hypothetical protein